MQMKSDQDEEEDEVVKQESENEYEEDNYEKTSDKNERDVGLSSVKKSSGVKESSQSPGKPESNEKHPN